MRGVYLRGKTYWIAYKAAHKVVRESTGTSDRKLAFGVLSKRRAEVFEGRWVGRLRDTRSPIHPAIEDYFKLYAKPRKVSWRDDWTILRRFEAFVGSGAHLQDINRKIIEQFLLKVLSRGASKARVNRYTAILKCFFNRCIDWQKLSANPCRGVRMYPETPRTHWLEAGQVSALLNACTDRLRPIVQFALLTGLRLGDILRLTWDRIDFQQGMIRVVQSKTQTPLALPISPALSSVLSSIPKNPDCPYVFQKGGKPIPRFGWRRSDFTEAVRAAGLKGTRMHDLRHTAATHLRRLGCDLPVVQQLLGHKTIRTTLRYAHVHPTELREAVEKLGNKMVPQTARHFTITSQSAEQVDVAESLLNENDAKSVSFSNVPINGIGTTTRTVNPESTSSEDW